MSILKKNYTERRENGIVAKSIGTGGLVCIRWAGYDHFCIYQESTHIWVGDVRPAESLGPGRYLFKGGDIGLLSNELVTVAGIINILESQSKQRA